MFNKDSTVPVATEQCGSHRVIPEVEPQNKPGEAELAVAAEDRQSDTTEAAELAEALVHGGQDAAAVVEGLHYLWRRGRIRELGELIEAIREELHEAGPGDPLPTPLDEDRPRRYEGRMDFAVAYRESVERFMVYLTTRVTSGEPDMVLARLNRSGLSKADQTIFAAYWEQGRGMFLQQLRRLTTDPEELESLLSDLAYHLLRPEVFGRLRPLFDFGYFVRLGVHAVRFVVGTHRNRDAGYRRRARVHSARWLRRQREIRFPTVEAVLTNEVKEIVRAALVDLTKRQREVIDRNYLQGQDLSEIAAEMGLTASLPSHHRNLGLKALRQLVPSSLDPGGRATCDVRAEISRLFQSGEPKYRIAKRLGTTPATVRRQLAKVG